MNKKPTKKKKNTVTYTYIYDIQSNTLILQNTTAVHIPPMTTNIVKYTQTTNTFSTNTK